MKILHSPFGELKLSRWPKRKNDTLRAWDAADEYLLEHLAEHKLPELSSRILVINDAFGALSCALDSFVLTHWSDSKISHLAAADNSTKEQCSLEYLQSTDELSGEYHLVLIKVPKTMALLEEQLIRLRSHLANDAKIVAAGMVKHLPKSAFQLFEKHIGSLTTSLAKKKARLIFVEPNQSLPVTSSPYPTSYSDDEIGLNLSNHANLFSRDHLDLGARFFLQQFAQLPDAKQVVDLACGNGVLGIKYQQQFPDSIIQFLDESYMAVASASSNYVQAFNNEIAKASFRAEDGLTQVENDSVGLILCNPPFHQQHVIGEQIAMELFHHSKRCLQAGGEIWIVANRHLDYPAKLKRLFGNCRLVSSDKKFVVLSSKKR